MTRTPVGVKLMGYTSGSFIGLFPREISVFANIWHVGKLVGQVLASRPLESGFQDLPMFLFGAPVVLRSTQLQRPYEFLGNISNHELRH